METISPDQHTSAPLRALSTAGGSLRILTWPVSGSQSPTPTQSVNPTECRPDSTDKCLQRFEAAAQEKFFQAIEDMPDVKLEGWFIRQLDNKIIPALTRIGFDETFARTLFQTAASSWQRMGPATNKCIWFHPDFTRSIKTIKNEMILKPGSNPVRFSASGVRNSSDLRKFANNIVDEEDPSTICQDWTSSWIILPRVYHFLEEEHSKYLLCYLEYLDNEAPSEFRRILARIIFEFVGNYTYKYRSKILSGCRMDTALFFGYAAMFWKNLRNPPQGFEDDLIFCHCLRWIKIFRSRCSELSPDLAVCISQMETYHQKVMLMEGALHSPDNDHQDLGRILVTLRHGSPGRLAAIDYMTNWLNSTGRDATGRLSFVAMPVALNKLFHTIKKQHPTEPPGTQKLVRKFLRKLKDNFAAKGVNGIGNSNPSSEQFRFVVGRVLGLIDGLVGAIA